MIADTPFFSRSSRCTASSSSRGRNVVPGAQLSPAGNGSFSSTTATIGLTPSAPIWRDTGPGWAPLRNLGRGVVRAAGAEVGQAVGHDAGFRECLLLEVEIGDPLAVAVA